MYKCMLNKKTDAADTPVLVPYEEYRSRAAAMPAARHRGNEDDEHGPPSSFILFHQDLVTLAAMRGLMLDSSAERLWGAIVKHVELVPVDDAPDDDA